MTESRHDAVIDAVTSAAPAPAASPTGDVERSSPWRAGIEQALAALAAAIESGDRLGLDTSPARSVQDESLARLRLPIDHFVVGFVGGTGVGKSSLVNAIAGTEVSAPGARRPTTREPVAWVSRRDLGLDELLHWLDVRRIVEGRSADGAGAARTAADVAGEPGSGALGLALLDLPDLDSIEVSHRRIVDELLPKLDAVAWVVDPEKYADALLHDGYLRHWMPRLGPQALVVNKLDLLAPDERRAVLRDAARLLGESERRQLRIVGASAAGEGVDAGDVGEVAPGAPFTAGGDGARAVAGVSVAELRAWIDVLAAEKAAAAERVRAAARTEVEGLAIAAGISETLAFSPLIPADVRRGAVAETHRRLAAALGLDRLEGLGGAVTRQAALDSGGPMGAARRVARAFGLGSGRSRPVREFLEGWRSRDSLLVASEPGAAAYRRGIETAPPLLRPVLADGGRQRGIVERLAAVAEAVPADIPERDLARPAARGWGTMNTIRAGAIAAAVVAAFWLVAGAVLRLPADPGASLLAAVAIAGLVVAVLGRLIVAGYGGYVGRRWGRRVAADAHRIIEHETSAALFGPVDQAEAARAVLRRAVMSADAAGGPGRR